MSKNKIKSKKQLLETYQLSSLCYKETMHWLINRNSDIKTYHKWCHWFDKYNSILRSINVYWHVCVWIISTTTVNPPFEQHECQLSHNRPSEFSNKTSTNTEYDICRSKPRAAITVMIFKKNSQENNTIKICENHMIKVDLRDTDLTRKLTTHCTRIMLNILRMWCFNNSW